MANTICLKDFKPRTTAPATNNKYYINIRKKGYNRAKVIDVKSGSCLPNCVAAVHGRWLETALNTDYKTCDKLCTGNAHSYWSFNDGYKRGQKARVGAIACWTGGKYGHVGYVEKVNADGSIYCSMSDDTNKVRWYYRTIKKVNGTYNYNNFGFQGFIYNPYVLTKKGFAKINPSGAGLRVRQSYTTQSKIVGHVEVGKSYAVYETKKNQGYTWYRIGTSEWIANNGEWITYKGV